LKRIAITFSIVAVVTGLRASLVGQAAQSPQAAARAYIVVFHDDERDVEGVAAAHGRAYGASVAHLYRHALKGYAATIPLARIDDVRRDPRVAFVSEDRRVEAVAQSVPTGIDRIDAEPSLHTPPPAWNLAVAIIDTGNGPHADLNVVGGKNCSTGRSFSDGNGHGTHVAGTIGGTTYGLAKGASLHGVRVLSCAGLGLTSHIIAGIDWVRQNAIKPAVANMSLGGGLSPALNDATTNLWNSGVFVAVAAGNDNVDACTASPASATGAFTAAASEKTDAKASYSNWGTCVEAYAPGSAIVSDFLGGTTMSLSGTSMASPHFAGVAVLYKATFGDQPSATVANWIVSNATNGVITGNPGGTPNRLLFKSSL